MTFVVARGAKSSFAFLTTICIGKLLDSSRNQTIIDSINGYTLFHFIVLRSFTGFCVLGSTNRRFAFFGRHLL